MQVLSMFVLTCFISLSLFSQQYYNGNLSTGVTSSNGVSAPVGYAWSEVQTGNEQAGFGAQIANNFTIPKVGNKDPNRFSLPLCF